MEQLFTPNVGLMIWTVLTFLILVFILGRFGWKPLLRGLDARENYLREQREATEKARLAAETLKRDQEIQMENLRGDIKSMLTQAKEDAQRDRDKMLETSRLESERILDKGRHDLQVETERIKEVLRSEVAGLAVTVAEKALQKSMDDKLREKVLKDALHEISGAKS
jgi:F-type H+-transporting ATPase subunit b